MSQLRHALWKCIQNCIIIHPLHLELETASRKNVVF
jgi:hypothetical protein